MKVIKVIIGYLPLVACICVHAMEGSHGSCQETAPSGVVQDYLQRDMDGAGLSTKGWVSQIQPLTVWEEGPGWDVAIIISKYEITKEQIKKDDTEVGVTYDVLGEWGETFTATPKQERATFRLTRPKKDGCLSWRIVSPQDAPHISRATAHRHLSGTQR